jgi:2,4-dienoyl-CoA reductase-like NADH-dependent reductase (Old Yellow Enzyme family)
MLFTTLALREVTLRNRIVMSPMCQYSAEDGFASDWHLVHLGTRAVGGAGLVMTEATAVEARGRISPRDLGIWKEEHVAALRRISSFVAAQGAVPGMQLAHAGRKGSTAVPWEGGRPLAEREGGWQVIGPSPLPFGSGYAVPRALDEQEVGDIVSAFASAARRALEAGFKIVEIHAAHGYLLHQFLSPLSNRRSDRYGGSFENRTRLVREVVRAVRTVWPERLPLFVRISATDWIDGGWDIEQSVELTRLLGAEGVDLIDCSSGGIRGEVKIPFAPGYQVPFAQRVRQETGLKTGAVGLITSAQQAEHILVTGQADLVVLARQLLRDPYWPLRAAFELRTDVPWPDQYLRARI